MTPKMTKDSDGTPIRDGDLISFGYGTPPVGVKARVVERDGKLIALTPHHKPTECELGLLKRYVGNFYKVAPKRTNPREIEANLFSRRAPKGEQHRP